MLVNLSSTSSSLENSNSKFTKLNPNAAQNISKIK